MQVFRVGPLPERSIEAAAAFHASVLPEILALARADRPLWAEDLVLIFPSAPFDHRGWRLAAVQGLAREATPKRVNGIAGHDEQAIAATLAWLEQAPGITGQLLAVEH